MGRPLRYIPPDALVEVTCRAIHGRYLLRPGRVIVGALAKAQQRYAMIVCGFVYLSNHAHLLLQPRDAEQLARFMNHVNSKIAKEAGRLHARRQKLWGRGQALRDLSSEAQTDPSDLAP